MNSAISVVTQLEIENFILHELDCVDMAASSWWSV